MDCIRGFTESWAGVGLPEQPPVACRFCHRGENEMIKGSLYPVIFPGNSQSYICGDCWQELLIHLHEEERTFPRHRQPKRGKFCSRCQNA